MKIEDAIEKFKEKNGGIITYTTKEMMGGLIEDFGEFKKEFNDYCKKTSVKVAVLEALVGIHTLILLAIITKILYF